MAILIFNWNHFDNEQCFVPVSLLKEKITNYMLNLADCMFFRKKN